MPGDLDFFTPDSPNNGGFNPGNNTSFQFEDDLLQQAGGIKGDNVFSRLERILGNRGFTSAGLGDLGGLQNLNPTQQRFIDRILAGGVNGAGVAGAGGGFQSALGEFNVLPPELYDAFVSQLLGDLENPQGLGDDNVNSLKRDVISNRAHELDSSIGRRSEELNRRGILESGITDQEIQQIERQVGDGRAQDLAQVNVQDAVLQQQNLQNTVSEIRQFAGIYGSLLTAQQQLQLAEMEFNAQKQLDELAQNLLLLNTQFSNSGGGSGSGSELQDIIDEILRGVGGFGGFGGNNGDLVI